MDNLPILSWENGDKDKTHLDGAKVLVALTPDDPDCKSLFVHEADFVDGTKGWFAQVNPTDGNSFTDKKTYPSQQDAISAATRMYLSRPFRKQRRRTRFSVEERRVAKQVAELGRGLYQHVTHGFWSIRGDGGEAVNLKSLDDVKRWAEDNEPPAR